MDCHTPAGALPKLTSIGDISKSEKFKSSMNLKPIDEIFISLIFFSDDFAKQKRSKWCPVDALCCWLDRLNENGLPLLYSINI